ncbi:MAG: CinA family nicotinamide mononucleotide deamidase-related protein [Flavobacteriaceae bacterium]|nr:CinA family nicotinamide mononucleotide deamidase-related protein [Flavobacteriaceae bacterium]
MQAEIITIGDEILIGQIVDTNSAWIAKELNKIGVELAFITSIADDIDVIVESLHTASKRSQIVLITGGLGPTKDDLTKKALCKYFDDKLVERSAALDNVKRLFGEVLKKPMNALNVAQAMMPSTAEILHNEFGTAPGMWFEKDNLIYVSMPGVPYEMKAIMQHYVLPKVQKKGKLPTIYHKTLLTVGLGESVIAERISDWEDQLPKHIKLAYLPSIGRVRLRLSARAFRPQESLEQEVDEKIAELHQRIGEIIVGEDVQNSFPAIAAELLKRNAASLSTAESFTGGTLGAAMVEIPGASKIFKGSIVSYLPEIKQSVLQVPQEIIEKHGEVSAEVAIAMAANAQKIMQSDYALSSTGNAGPDSLSPDLPIGLAFIGIATPNKVFAVECHLGNHRDKVMRAAVSRAYELLQKELLE